MRNRNVTKLISAVFAVLFGFVCIQKTLSQELDPWGDLRILINHIVPPKFADKDFIITSYGAVGDGVTNCSKAIQKAIIMCCQAGGGRVIIPSGAYCTGPIYLKSNVNLHLEKGATLLFSTNPDDYLPLVYTRWEGIELMNYSPLIYSYKERNIAITGEGVLDGQSANSNWWSWKGRKNHGWKVGTPNQTDSDKRPALFEMAEKNVPVNQRKFGKGYYLRPQFIQPYLCDNVLIEGVKILNSPI